MHHVWQNPSISRPWWKKLAASVLIVAAESQEILLQCLLHTHDVMWYVSCGINGNADTYSLLLSLTLQTSKTNEIIFAACCVINTMFFFLLFLLTCPGELELLNSLKLHYLTQQTEWLIDELKKWHLEMKTSHMNGMLFISVTFLKHQSEFLSNKK